LDHCGRLGIKLRSRRKSVEVEAVPQITDELVEACRRLLTTVQLRSNTYFL
jgi:hypothetical protein